MTVEEVRAIMGKPDDTNLVADMWFPESGNRYNQLKVLYVGGVAARAIWISLTHDGHFVLFG